MFSKSLGSSPIVCHSNTTSLSFNCSVNHFMACKLKITTGQCPYQLSSRLATKSFPIDLFVASWRASPNIIIIYIWIYITNSFIIFSKKGTRSRMLKSIIFNTNIMHQLLNSESFITRLFLATSFFLCTSFFLGQTFFLFIFFIKTIWSTFLIPSTLDR